MARRKKSRFSRLKHVFIPTRENGRHPHALRFNVAAAALLIAVAVEFGFLAQVFTGFQNTAFTASVLPSVVATLTNDQRGTNGVAPLSVNPLLTEAAQMKANDMAAKGYFAHVAPDGTLPWYWFTKVGYDYEYAGENLAVNFDDSTQLVNAWMASPAHRENILKPEYTQIGIGMATGTYEGKETLFVVQFFGKPQSAVAQSVGTVASARPAAPAVTEVASSAPAPSASEPISTANAAANVLGTSTTNVPTSLSLWEEIQTSPKTYATYALFALLMVFVLMLVLASLPFHALPHPNTILNGLAVIVVVLGIMLVNQSTVISRLQLPASDQNAAVAVAVQ